MIDQDTQSGLNKLQGQLDQLSLQYRNHTHDNTNTFRVDSTEVLITQVNLIGTGVSALTAPLDTPINGVSRILYDGTNYVLWERVNNTWKPIISAVAGQTPGTKTNDNASAGNVGEYISSTIATGSSVSLSTGVVSNITNISLTAGDWDVTGVVDFNPGATTTTTYLQGGVSTTSGTIGAQDSYFTNTFAIATTSVDASEVCPTVRFSLASTTTIYLVAKAGFLVSTLKAYGSIRARRIR